MFFLALLQAAADPYAIPYEELTEEDAAFVRSVVGQPTLTVDLDAADVDSSLDVYDFCLQELPFTGALAQLLTPVRYDISRESDVTRERPITERMKRSFLILDGDGMSVKMTRVHYRGGRWIYYSRGRYDAGLLDIYSRAVIVVVAQPVGDKLRTTARVFMRVDEGLGSLAADLFDSTVRQVIREKSTRFIDAARTVTEAARREPGRVLRLAGLDASIDRGVLEQFRKKFLNR
jgi:hypothetical protein